MKAVVVNKPGGAEQLKIDEVDPPVIKENEILIKVHAAALNRADILQREGKYPPPPGASEILGLEASGQVYSVGRAVKRYKIGDKVFGLLPGGGYAEFAAINEFMANPIPRGLSYEEAAAIPEVFLTAYQALIWHSKLQKGERILIHAGASGVGTAAIQIARLIGAEIFVTASSEKHKICLALGAQHAVDYKREAFDKRIDEITNHRGVNVIIDFIAGPYFSQNLNSLARDGRLVLLATMGGGKVTEVDIRRILSNRLTIIGSTLRSRYVDYQIRLNEEFIGLSLDKFKNGLLKAVIDRVFDWKDVSEAHKYMESNQNSGKIVLKISD